VHRCYTSQTLAEFWNASTRPANKNGFGLTVAETDSLARVIERDFELLPDRRETHERWRALRCSSSTALTACRCMTQGWRPACMFTPSTGC
jgi:hypothetical protein